VSKKEQNGWFDVLSERDIQTGNHGWVFTEQQNRVMVE
jgi:hypothetical protein